MEPNKPKRKYTRKVKVKAVEAVEPDVDLNIITLENTQELPSAGLGDVVRKFTKALGIHECVECTQRKAKLNKLFPFLKLSRQITQEEKDLMKTIALSHIITGENVSKLFNLYNELFNTKYEKCQCSALIGQLIIRIDTFINDEE